MDKEQLLYNYEERIAICLESPDNFLLDAKKIARLQIIEEIEQLGFKRAEAVYEVHKLIKESNESRSYY